MSEDRNRSARDKLVQSLGNAIPEFPEKQQVLKEVVDGLLLGTLEVASESFEQGFKSGFKAARQANKFSLAIRSIAVTVLCPVFVTFGSNVAGENIFGLLVGGLAAATVFFVQEEVLDSTIKLFKKDKKDGKSGTTNSGTEG